jgi:aspartate aminotransferase
MVHPQGAFYLFFEVKAYLGKNVQGKTLKTSEDISEYFLNVHKVAMVPGTGFGEKNWIRLSYACSMTELEKGLARIKAGLSEIGGGK